MKNVDDIYPLSPIQNVMLLHSLSDPNLDLLRDQACYEIRGTIDPDRFRTAWEAIVNRHPALRTAFVWEDLKQPLQVVRSKIELPYCEFDLRDLPNEDQQSRIAEYRSHDRQQRFAFTEAPLLRLALFRLSEDRNYFVLTSHHLILDHWCISIIHDEFAHIYRHGSDALPTATPFRNYIAWIQQKENDVAKAFWSTKLSGIVAADPLFRRSAKEQSREATHTVKTCRLDESDTASLRAFAQQNGLTLGTILQASWALVLAEMRGHLDVVFGSTVAGRPPEVLGVDGMVGSFINNLPMRVVGGPDERIDSFLRRTHAELQQARLVDYVSPAQIHQWSGLPNHQMLFETLLVQLAPVTELRSAEIVLQPVNSPLRTAVPLTVTFAEDDSGLEIQLSQLANHDGVAELDGIAARLICILQQVSGPPERTLGEIISLDRAETSAFPAGETVSGTDDRPLSHNKLASEIWTNQQKNGKRDRELEALQQQLGAEWCELFGLIDPETSFFDLGGTSLQAALFHQRVQAITKKSIPLVRLFQNPTLAAMVDLLHTGQWTVCQDTIATIQPHGSRCPLFCIATPEVNAIGYAALSRHLGKDQPLYVVQSVGEDQRRPTHEELANFVPRYIDAIRDVQPDGPYRILGMCSGAHLAFDIAMGLSKRGESTEFLGILDTWARNTQRPRTPVIRARRRMTYYARRLSLWSQLDRKEKLSELRNIAARKWSGVNRRAGQPSATVETVQTDSPKSDTCAWDQSEPCAVDVKTERYNGTVTVFRRRKQPYSRINDEQLGWGANAANVVTRMLACNEEYTAVLREPHVQDLAVHIQQSLPEQQADDQPTKA